MDNNFQNNLFAEKRFQLIQELKTKGIKDKRVLNALNNLPRELFVEEPFINRAYEDNALPIKCNQTISQPYTVAYMTELLDVQQGNKILEIGTGSGFQAALLHLLGAEVYTIERFEELAINAMKKFQNLGFNIKVYTGDGTKGLPEFAPYDRIIVTAAAPQEPKSLIKQLKIGGKLVIPIGDKRYQIMHLIIRLNENNYRDIEKGEFRFVPLIGDEGWKE